MTKEFSDLKKFIREQEIITRRTILKNSQKNDHHAIKTQWMKFVKKEKRESQGKKITSIPMVERKSF